MQTIKPNSKQQKPFEDPEGYDVDTSLGEYPIDTVLIRNETRTVFDILRRIEKGGYVLDPDYQRDFIWTEDKQSKLIESVLMRIPLPVFYFAENEKGQNIVVDGLQRISTFERFVNNKLKLKLPAQEVLNGMRFCDLAPKLQNRIEDCNLTLYIIDSKVHPQVQLDIFERVNSGATLTRQQMRNCLYMGKGTRLIKRLAQLSEFTTATGGSLDPNKMRDREFVNRFCAFSIFGYKNYKGDMDDFLVKSLKKMNSMSDEEILNLENMFYSSMKNNINLFQKHSFRKSAFSGPERSVINASIWDVMSIGLSKYSTDEIKNRKSELLLRFKKLFSDQDFLTSITLGTNQENRVKMRFELTNIILREVMG